VNISEQGEPIRADWWAEDQVVLGDDPIGTVGNALVQLFHQVRHIYEAAGYNYNEETFLKTIQFATSNYQGGHLTWQGHQTCGDCRQQYLGDRCGCRLKAPVYDPGSGSDMPDDPEFYRNYRAEEMP